MAHQRRCSRLARPSGRAPRDITNKPVPGALIARIVVIGHRVLQRDDDQSMVLT
jgi:hypothetical protein